MGKYSIETVGVETLSEFQTIIKFIRYNTWRVARGEGKVQLAASAITSHMKVLIFTDHQNNDYDSPTFNTDHGFELKIIEVLRMLS